jgi:NADPH2:quinone reductase
MSSSAAATAPPTTASRPALRAGHRGRRIRPRTRRAALKDEKVGIVVDPVGGELRKPSLDVLAPEGQLLVVGHASGNPDEPFTGDDLWRRSIGATGFVVGTFLHADPSRAKPALEAVSRLVVDGTLRVPVQTLKLAQAAVAHRHLEERTNTGRLILTTD